VLNDAAPRSSQVQLVLDGLLPYDELRSREEQAQVRAEWDRRMTARLARLDLMPELLASGLPFAEADADGRLRMVSPRT
jgi:hypothetical protein